MALIYVFYVSDVSNTYMFENSSEIKLNWMAILLSTIFTNLIWFRKEKLEHTKLKDKF